MTTQQDNQVLAGYRILDVGHVLAGPMTSSMLADFGADVIHIESPETGDFMREVQGRGGGERISRGYDIINRNKRNISLDMRRPEAREIFHRLVAVSDAVTANFRPYVMDRWGHDWETLRRVNPRLIYCRMSGFGGTGPYRHRRAYGMIGEAFSGWAWLNGYPDGPAMHSSFSLGDTTDSIWAATMITMALYWRDVRGGEGQLIDQGLVEPLYRQLEQNIIVYDQTGVIPTRAGTHHEATPYADVCETRDGRYFSYHAPAYEDIDRLLETLGLAGDARFATMQACKQNKEAFWEIAAQWFRERTLDEVISAFEKNQAVGAQVMSGKDLVEDPHIQAREMIVSVPDPEGGKDVVMQGIVPKLSETPGKMRNANEPLGARNEEVYCGLLGMSKEDLQALKDAKII